MSAKGNAQTFRLNLRRHPDTWRQKVLEVLNVLTLKLHATIVGHPDHRVDTGYMRASWAIAAENPTDYLPPAVDRHGRKPGDPPLLDAPDGAVFYGSIANAPITKRRVVFTNVEYAPWVELGTETTEGQHVARSAVQEMVTAGGG